MSERPAKLPPSAILVVWGARQLTLTEKVVWYHDWALDQGGADGSYISVRSMSLRLGGSLAPHTIEQARGRLKRLGLHEALQRRDARNRGWVATLPAQCVAHRAKDGATCAVLLDTYITAREAWLEQRLGVGESDGQPLVRATASGAGSAAALVGGLGGSLLESVSETQLPSTVSQRQKGVGSPEPEGREERRDPAVVRAEGQALIRLQLGKKLTPEERHLVKGWLERHPAKAKELSA